MNLLTCVHGSESGVPSAHVSAQVAVEPSAQVPIHNRNIINNLQRPDVSPAKRIDFLNLLSVSTIL